MYYLNAKKFFDDRLTIFQKTVSKNWYGRIYIDGKSKEISSKTRNFKTAKTTLFKWYHSLQYAQSHNLIIHDIQFNKLFKKYIEYRKENKSGRYTDNIENTFYSFFKDYFHNRKINSISKSTVIEYLRTRQKNYKKKSKKELSTFTLQQDLMMLSGFFTWCDENNHRSKRLRVSTKWIKEVSTVIDRDTRRTFFRIKDYDKLLSFSRGRIKETENELWKWRREYLHQFIVFMCHSGLRTGEAYNLKWSDVTYEDKLKRSNQKYCELNVTGKRGARKVYTKFGSYFALKKIEELQKSYGVKNEKVFYFRFRKGLNYLLKDVGLKYQKYGDKDLVRDSKSFRSTYISWSLINGQNIDAIARNCGTSVKVIQDFYSKYIKVEEYKKDLVKINSVKTHIR